MKDETPLPPLTDSDKITFGKHKGKALAKVPAHYLLWLYNEGCNDARVKEYIVANLDELEKEAHRNKPYRKW